MRLPCSACPSLKYAAPIIARIHFSLWQPTLNWLGMAFYRNRIREKRLFTNGEVSEGVVLTQSDKRIGSRIVERNDIHLLEGEDAGIHHA